MQSLTNITSKESVIFPHIASAMKEEKTRKQLAIKLDNLLVILKLNNTRQFINLTDGKTNKSIYGKISISGKPLFKVNTPLALIEALTALEHDPKLLAKVKPRKTATCQICGKELSDPSSIDRGIGPECMGNADMLNSLEED